MEVAVAGDCFLVTAPYDDYCTYMFKYDGVSTISETGAFSSGYSSVTMTDKYAVIGNTDANRLPVRF